VKAISLPGTPGVGHQWSYLPDVARTMVALLQRREALEPFAVFHMAGHWDADGTQMAESIRRIVTRQCGAKPAVRAFPWWLAAWAAPFVPTLHELREMRSLWNVPVGMDNAKLLVVLGREPHTPLNAAVEAALVGTGCLAADRARKGGSVGHAVGAKG
jgi:nucleoside-diphosphate-sugar epimerase